VRDVEDPSTACEGIERRAITTTHVEEGVTNVKGFPGGPHDTSVLRDFENHIALRVWNGDVCKS